MPTPTYVAIAKNVLSSDQSSISLSAIPSTYTDLLLVASARVTTAAGYVTTKVEVNSATTNFSARQLYTLGTTVGSAASTSAYYLYLPGANCTTNSFGNAELYFPNYAGSTNKVISISNVNESNDTTDDRYRLNAIAGLWSNTAAITSITVTPTSGNLLTGSRFDLYGIKNS